MDNEKCYVAYDKTVEWLAVIGLGRTEEEAIKEPIEKGIPKVEIGILTVNENEYQKLVDFYC